MVKHFVSLQNFLAQSLRRDDRGATAVEYALIVVLVAVAIIGTVTAMSTALQKTFQTIGTDITGAL